MKKKLLSILVVVVALVICSCLILSACDKKTDTDETADTVKYRFSAPEGTPALAMLRLVTDNKVISNVEMEYEVVTPSNIAGEMAGKKSDLVIMPINAGANLIRQGADYKLVSVAVNGSLYMVGKTAEGSTITFDQIKGKKIACIGQTAVPGMVFRYVMNKNNIVMKSENEVPDAANNEISVRYVADGNAAKALIANDSVDFAVVGEPAATVFKTPAVGCNAEMNMQTAYAACSDEGITNYPQAGLFVKTSIANDSAFMTALFTALAASKEWVLANTSAVTEFAKANLYESAAFPAGSIARCAINGTAITAAEKTEVIAFLKSVAGKDANNNVIDWDNVALFA